MEDTQHKSSRVEAVELAISKLLRIGVVIAAAVIAVGLIQLLITGQTGYAPDEYPHQLHGIIEGLGSWKSAAVIEAGLLLLILTPVFRVLVSLIAFAQEKDYRFVAISAIVLVILIISFVLGKAG